MYKLELSDDEINVVLKGLGELPSKESFGTIIKVRQQVDPQIKTEDEKREE